MSILHCNKKIVAPNGNWITKSNDECVRSLIVYYDNERMLGIELEYNDGTCDCIGDTRVCNTYTGCDFDRDEVLQDPFIVYYGGKTSEDLEYIVSFNMKSNGYLTTLGCDGGVGSYVLGPVDGRRIAGFTAIIGTNMNYQNGFIQAIGLLVL